MTRLVGLDTSSSITGFSLYERAKLKEHGILDHHKEKDVLIRTEDMVIDISRILKEYKPQIIVIESPPLVNSPKTLILLSEIVGVVRGWSIASGYAEYVEYGANEWRKLIAGEDEKVPRSRNDAKPWDMEKVRNLFGVEPVDDNEADGILVGAARIKQMCGQIFV